jgi:hypothetical protein
MTKLAILVITALLVGASSSQATLHPGHRWGSHSVQLCNQVKFQLTIPRWAHYSDEKVNGHAIKAWQMGQTTYFFGQGISGMLRENDATHFSVGAARFVSDCVRLTIIWAEQ